MPDAILATLVSNDFMTLMKRGAWDAPYWEEQLDGYKTYEYFSKGIDLFNRIKEINPQLADNEHWVAFWLEQADDSLYAVSATGGINPIPKNRYFDPHAGILLAWDDGNFEVVRKDLTYKLLFTRYYYAQERREIVLTGEQIIGLHVVNGLKYLQRLVAELRLEHWEHRPIWTVLAQCKILSNQCSVAFDGSAHHISYYFVPASNAQEALEKATIIIENDFMSMMQVYEIQKFDEVLWSDNSTFANDMCAHAKQAYERQQVLSYGASQESIFSLLTTAHFSIVSLGHFDEKYWSTRVAHIHQSEWFLDESMLFSRLVALKLVMSEEQTVVFDLYKQGSTDDVDNHYRILPYGSSKRFEKILRHFPENDGLLIDWKDWDYDFVSDGAQYRLWVYIGGIADQSCEIVLNEEQVSRYQKEGISFIHQLSEELKRR